MYDVILSHRKTFLLPPDSSQRSQQIPDGEGISLLLHHIPMIVGWFSYWFSVIIMCFGSILQAYANLLRGNMTNLKKKGKSKADSRKQLKS